MSPNRPPKLLIGVAAVLLASFAVHAAFGFGSAAADHAYDLWFQPSAFLASGCATLLRAYRIREERAPWTVLGLALVLYALGSVTYNLAFADDATPPFPSVADGLWLALYPLAFTAVAMLVRHRFARVTAS